jgi:hypothetical protein
MTQYAESSYQPVVKILLLCLYCAISHLKPRLVTSAKRIAITAVLMQGYLRYDFTSMAMRCRYDTHEPRTQNTIHTDDMHHALLQ